MTVLVFKKSSIVSAFNFVSKKQLKTLYFNVLHRSRIRIDL